VGSLAHADEQAKTSPHYRIALIRPVSNPLVARKSELPATAYAVEPNRIRAILVEMVVVDFNAKARIPQDASELAAQLPVGEENAAQAAWTYRSYRIA
jgi:hypothetical protein